MRRGVWGAAAPRGGGVGLGLWMSPNPMDFIGFLGYGTSEALTKNDGNPKFGRFPAMLGPETHPQRGQGRKVGPQIV